MREFPNLPARLFVTGTDTDAGKSYATGWLAREAMRKGQTVITQKLIQTGNKDYSEDIDVHRRITGTGMLKRDLDHTTAPIILSYPASPDLAAKIDGVEVDFSVASMATRILSEEFDSVIVEGAGGIMVPLKGDYLTIDYVKEEGLPVAVVTNGRLGSINHTLLTLDALKSREIAVFALVYNPYFDKDDYINKNTRDYLQRYIGKHYPGCLYLEMPAIL